MSKKKTVDVSYAEGFMYGQQAEDGADEDGDVQTAAGRRMRCRVDRIDHYLANSPGIIDVYLIGRDEPLMFVGSVVGVDRAIARHRAMTAPLVNRDTSK